MSAHTHHGPAAFGCVLRIDHAEMLPGLLVMVVLGIFVICMCIGVAGVVTMVTCVMVIGIMSATVCCIDFAVQAVECS